MSVSSSPLAARRLVDFAGPLGWQHSATNLGRITSIDAPFEGIAEASTHEAVPIGADCDRYPRHVAALDLLLNAGVDGPYGMALGPAAYGLVLESTEDGGWLLLDHLRKILDGPLVWAPGVEGAVVMSMRGGDFLFESGEDISVGYFSHDAEVVTFYLEESFSFRVASPEAAVVLSRRAPGLGVTRGGASARRRPRRPGAAGAARARRAGRPAG